MVSSAASNYNTTVTKYIPGVCWVGAGGEDCGRPISGGGESVASAACWARISAWTSLLMSSKSSLRGSAACRWLGGGGGGRTAVAEGKAATARVACCWLGGVEGWCVETAEDEAVAARVDGRVERRVGGC